MERVATSPAPSEAGRCVVCGTENAEHRCGHCGAVARAGPYTVVRVLSQTAHGRVYLAEGEQGEKVALKELLYTLVPSTAELDAFERESRLLATLSHPRIPRFLRGFTEGRGVHTRLYLAQEFISGEDVARRVERKRFDEDEAFKLALQVLEILDWLHHRTPPLVHRDVKPQNLVLSANGEVHLVDFGTARDVAGTQTYRSTLVGTIGYMAPEQLGGTVGPKSDLYSLGATLLHVLTGKSPELLASPGAEVDLSKLNLSSQMTRFLKGLLAARPADRFPSARAAIDAIFDPRRLSDAPAAARKSKAPLGLALAAAGATMLLTLGAIGFVALGARQDPRPVLVVPPPAPVAAAPVKLEPVPEPRFDEQPPVELTHFNWELATWDFSKPGSWILDTTGHQHSAPYPRSGYRLEFFGPVWDGSQHLWVPDAPSLAPRGPFTLHLEIGKRVAKDGPPKVEHLITRGDPAGRFSYDVSLIGETLRFSIADEQGRVSSIEAKTRVEGNSATSDYQAVFDPKSGEQTLLKLGECQPLAQTTTSIRPAQHVDEPKVHLLEGFSGLVLRIGLSRGLERITPSPSGTHCGLHGDRLND